MKIIGQKAADHPGMLKKLKTTRFGMTLNKYSIFAITAATLPISVTISLLLGFTPAVILAAVLPTILIGGASQVLHPLIHLPREEAVAQSSGFVRWLLTTRYAEVISAFHYVHHNGGVAANYNLVPGGDYAARFIAEIFNFKNSLEAATKPNLNMVIRMGKLGLIGGVRNPGP